jgi:hypothetical protein
MERVPGEKAPILAKARIIAAPERGIVDRRVKVAEDRAREPAKVPAAVRAKEAERDKAAEGGLD